MSRFVVNKVAHNYNPEFPINGRAKVGRLVEFCFELNEFSEFKCFRQVTFSYNGFEL